MKVILFFVLLLATFDAAVLAANDSKECSVVMEELRQAQLTRLFRLEEEFRKAAWEYRKYQETVYTPLWQAARSKNDRFSREKRIAGEIAFERYRHEADVFQEKARQAFNHIRLHLDSLASGFPREDACRHAGDGNPQHFSDFNNCTEIFMAETGDRLVSLRRHLLKYYNGQEAFSET